MLSASLIVVWGKLGYEMSYLVVLKVTRLYDWCCCCCGHGSAPSHRTLSNISKQVFRCPVLPLVSEDVQTLFSTYLNSFIETTFDSLDYTAWHTL